MSRDFAVILYEYGSKYEKPGAGVGFFNGSSVPYFINFFKLIPQLPCLTTFKFGLARKTSKAIQVFLKDIAALISPTHHMINCALILNAWFSSHVLHSKIKGNCCQDY